MNYSLNVVLLPQSSKIAGSVNSQLEMLGGLKTSKKTSENLRDEITRTGNGLVKSKVQIY